MTPDANPPSPSRLSLKALLLLLVFAGGFLLGRWSALPPAAAAPALLDQINPPQGVALPVTFGSLGPNLLAAGAIDLERFVQSYRQGGRPLTDAQTAILTSGSRDPVLFNRENSHFLLNFFWAVGLVNDNPLLTQGALLAQGREQAGRFASTGGWTLGAKPAVELLASARLLTLTAEQQARLEEAAAAVYRPCCNNPTSFPDCNHGMAMLGLLELMASQNATLDEMFEAARYANAFWFPQQMLEVAIMIHIMQNVDFAQAGARLVVSREYFSAAGYQAVHRWLEANNLLPTAPNSGGSCGVQ